MPNRILAGAFLLALATIRRRASLIGKYALFLGVPVIGGIIVGLCGGAHAAIGEAPAECLTLAADLKAVRESGAPIRTYPYQGIAAKHAMAVLIELGAPDSEIWGNATAVLLMVGSPTADPHAVVKFFNSEGCAFSALATDANGVAQFLAKIGDTI